MSTEYQRLSDIVSKLPPLPPIPSELRNQRAKWLPHHINYFFELIATLDEGRFRALLKQPPAVQNKNNTLLRLYWIWVHREFTNYTILDGAYFEFDQMRSKYKHRKTMPKRHGYILPVKLEDTSESFKESSFEAGVPSLSSSPQETDSNPSVETGENLEIGAATENSNQSENEPFIMKYEMDGQLMHDDLFRNPYNEEEGETSLHSLRLEREKEELEMVKERRIRERTKFELEQKILLKKYEILQTIQSEVQNGNKDVLKDIVKI